MKRLLISSLALVMVQDVHATAPSSARPRPKLSGPKGRPALVHQGTPQMVHTPLYKQPVTLVGQSSSSEVSIFVDPWTERRSAPRLRLQWDVSSVVDLSLSTLTVELDNGPIFSTTLQKVQSTRTLELSLSGISGGFHVIRMRARLLTAGDPCQSQYDRELWLRLSPESELTYLRGPIQNKDDHVGGILSAWRGSPSPVQIQTSLPIHRASVFAYLQAARWLGRNGLQAESAAREASPKSLVLRTTVSGPDETTPWEPALLGSFYRQGSQLVATAKDADDLGVLFERLQQADSLSRCTERLCLLSRPSQHRKDTPPSERTEPTQHEDAVVTLAQQGLRSGYTARGGGWHQLRIHWERPDAVTLSGSPELRLDVQTAAPASFDRSASSLTVKMGDRPLASFSPALLTPEMMPLRVKIPKELWELKSWSFEVETNLRTQQTERCRSIDESTLWLTIGATSGIYAQYTERKYPGTLASIAERAQRSSVQIVHSNTLNWAAVAALSSVLLPLSSRSAWQIVGSQDECDELCIVPQVGALPESSPLALLAIRGSLHWIDRHDLFHIPLLSAEGTVFLDVPKVQSPSPSLRKRELLWVHFPLDYSATNVPESLDLASQPYSALLWSGTRWLPLGEPSLGVLPDPASHPGTGLSDSHRKAADDGLPRQAVDAVWLLGSVGVVYLAVRIAKRRRKPSTVMNF